MSTLPYTRFTPFFSHPLFTFPDLGVEFCTILNRAIRSDEPAVLVPAVVVAVAINLRRNLFRKQLLTKDDFKAGRKLARAAPFPKSGTCYRGA